MAIKLLVVGPTKEDYFQKSEAEYLKRLTRYVKLQQIVVPSSKKSSVREECLAMEGEHILKHIGKGDYVVLLDENGKEYTSRQWATQLNKDLVGERDIVYIIGGAFGFSEKVYYRANSKWSLSKLTFPHHLVRTIFLEQMYRAFTILKGGKYHND